MSVKQYTPIFFEHSYEGSIIKKSLSHYIWKFNLAGKVHKVEFINSSFGKKKVILDEEVLIDTSNIFQMSWKFPFVLRSYNMEIVENGKGAFDLLCDRTSFAELYRGNLSVDHEKMHNNLKLDNTGQYAGLEGFNSGTLSSQTQNSNYRVPRNINLLSNVQQNQPQVDQFNPNQNTMAQQQNSNAADAQFFNSNFGGEFGSENNNNFKWDGFSNVQAQPSRVTPQFIPVVVNQVQSTPFDDDYSIKQSNNIEQHSMIPQTVKRTITVPNDYQQSSNPFSEAPVINSATDPFSGFGNSGTLVKNKGKDSSFNYVFSDQSDPTKKPLDSNAFDQQYKAYMVSGEEKGGHYHPTIVTEILRDKETKGNGKFHVPFEKINLDEGVVKAFNKTKDFFSKTEAALETFEVGVKSYMKKFTHPRNVDKQAERDLKEDRKKSEFGTDYSRINKGFGGKDLVIGDFKFDENFGGQKMVQEQKQEKVMAGKQQNQIFGGGFDNFSNQNQPNQYGQGQNLGNDGFLDFDIAFGQ